MFIAFPPCTHITKEHNGSSFPIKYLPKDGSAIDLLHGWRTLEQVRQCWRVTKRYWLEMSSIVYAAICCTSNQTTANLQKAPAKSSISKKVYYYRTNVLRVFISRFLATTCNSGDSTASRAQILSSKPPVQNSTNWVAPVVFLITPLHGPSWKHSFQQLRCVYHAAAWQRLLSRCFFRSLCLATGMYATIWIWIITVTDCNIAIMNNYVVAYCQQVSDVFDANLIKV
jgi:hypothetical protein